MPNDDDGYQAVDSSTDWMRFEPQHMWHVVALGMFAAAVYAGINLLFGQSVVRALVSASFFGLFFTALGAYRLRRRRRSPTS